MDDLWVVLPHLGAGGAQKVGLLAAEHFAAQGYKVRVLSLRHGHPIKHRLPENITTFDLGPDNDLNVHPWLRDVWNRSLLARTRRFCVAQCIKLRRLVIRVTMALVLRSMQWTWPLIEAKIQPGSDAIPIRLLNWCMRGSGGVIYRRLRELMLEHRPRRVLALLTKTNILCCAAVWDLPIHLVVSERNDPRLQRLDRLWNRLRCVYYRRADVVTANTEGVLQALQEMGHWQRLDLLPNPLPAGLSLREGDGCSSQRQQEVLAVARLVPQKGLDVLIRAFALLPGSVRQGWRLTLVGDGPERDALEDLVDQQDLRSKVCFEGFQSDPLQFMQRASIFALPSRFEGMPNALLEAMAAGLPSVVSDASPGPLEMVRDGREGLVVGTGDDVAFGAALERLMQDAHLRQRCGDSARETLRSLDWAVVEPHWRSVLALPAQP
ncbi:glycosyltransferase [Synechococcus sp. MIT S9504]|uniref:glycosyltransferase n=1 Tax=Synechococcus sp. MIT S9504 TaxID=1801628 RepID=UPI0007BB0E95|nr:glycosyltransferase [Synechococcus sp. MIT S9504]KZR85048.1 Protein Glycosylation H_2 [Synechococcus sp. MIT S9504]